MRGKRRNNRSGGRRHRQPKAPPAKRLRLRVERLGHRGDGIARPEAGGEPVYVPGTLPGEVIEAEVAGDRGRLLEVVEPAVNRVEPGCPVYGVCGGCASQHMAPETYAAWKRDIVVTALRNQGIETEIGPLVEAHGPENDGGRRRVTLHTVRTASGTIAVGFNRKRDRSIVDLDACPLLSGDLDRVMELGRAVAEIAGGPRGALDLRVNATDSGLDVAVSGAGPIKLDHRERLAAASDAFNLARLCVDGETLAERRRPVLDVGGVALTPPPGGFLQATRAGEEALSRLVLEHAPDAGVVADLFCGVGPFTLRLAARQPVLARDSDMEALRALEQAVNRALRLKPVDIRHQDLFESPVTAEELADCACVVIDPPRAGAETQARELAASAVPMIIAVSCHPATFARDAAILIEGGYGLGRVTPVDQFRHAAHVELVGVFTR